MTDIAADIAQARVTGAPNEAVDTQGVTAAEARAIIAGARSHHVREAEIYSAFASLGLGNLYRDAARGVSTRAVRGSEPSPDNADNRASDAINDARVAYVSAHRLTAGQLTNTIAAMDALSAAANSSNPNWTTVNVGDDERANQILTRASSATSLARKMYYDAFGMAPSPARAALVTQACRLLDAAERLGTSPFVRAHTGEVAAGPKSALTTELATLRSGLRNLPQS